MGKKKDKNKAEDTGEAPVEDGAKASVEGELAQHNYARMDCLRMAIGNQSGLTKAQAKTAVENAKSFYDFAIGNA